MNPISWSILLGLDAPARSQIAQTWSFNFIPSYKSVGPSKMHVAP